MDFRLTSEQEAIRKKAADFAKEYVEPVAAELDEKAEFPHENVKINGRARLSRSSVSERI